MARKIRSMKPEIIDDEKTGPLLDSAFRLFVSMILLADDAGNVRADARWLQGQVWWAHADRPDVSSLLENLRSVGLIQMYEVRGGVYARLNGWAKHQRIDNASARGRNPSLDESEVSDRSDLPIPMPTRGDSPRTAETRGSDLDLERDPDQEGKGIVAPKSAPKRGSTMSSDWAPRGEESAKAKELGLDLTSETEQFRDYHTAKGSVMKDWDAAFRTWLRNAKKWQRASFGGGSKPEPKRTLNDLSRRS